MPTAPARGGRIIAVAAPRVRVKKGGLDGGVVLGGLAAAVAITLVWRLVRRRGLHEERST